MPGISRSYTYLKASIHIELDTLTHWGANWAMPLSPLCILLNQYQLRSPCGTWGIFQRSSRYKIRMMLGSCKIVKTVMTHDQICPICFSCRKSWSTAVQQAFSGWKRKTCGRCWCRVRASDEENLFTDCRLWLWCWRDYCHLSIPQQRFV